MTIEPIFNIGEMVWRALNTGTPMQRTIISIKTHTNQKRTKITYGLAEGSGFEEKSVNELIFHTYEKAKAQSIILAKRQEERIKRIQKTEYDNALQIVKEYTPKKLN